MCFGLPQACGFNIRALQFGLILVLITHLGSAIGDEVEDSSGNQDASITREEWNKRIGEAKRRTEEFVERAKANKEAVLNSEEQKNAAEIRRALEDPTLMPGDLISDGKGLYLKNNLPTIKFRDDDNRR
jgi:hypothetical protein